MRRRSCIEQDIKEQILKFIVPLVLLFFGMSSNASIVLPKSTLCIHEKSKIVAFELTNNDKRLSYRTIDGRNVFLAEGTKGVLTGIFRGAIQRGNNDEIENPWVDISEIPSLKERFNKAKSLDFKVIYLPLSHVLTPKDLGLNDDWVIMYFAFDYDHHKVAYNEKFWQFGVKNKKTGSTNTFIASDIEERILSRCHIGGKQK